MYGDIIYAALYWWNIGAGTLVQYIVYHKILLGLYHTRSVPEYSKEMLDLIIDVSQKILKKELNH